MTLNTPGSAGSVGYPGPDASGIPPFNPPLNPPPASLLHSSSIGAMGFSAAMPAGMPAGVAHTAALLPPTVTNITVTADSSTPPVSSHKTQHTSPKDLIERVNRQETQKRKAIEAQTADWKKTSLKTSKVFNVIIMAAGVLAAFAVAAVGILCPPVGLMAIMGYVVGMNIAPVLGAIMFGYGLANIHDEVSWKPESIAANEKKVATINKNLETVTQALKLFESHPNVGDGTSFEEFLNTFDTGYKFNLNNLKEIANLYTSKEKADLDKLKKELDELDDKASEYEMLEESYKEFSGYVIANDVGPDYKTFDELLDRVKAGTTTKYGIERDKLGKLQSQIDKLQKEIDAIPKPLITATDPQSLDTWKRIQTLIAEKEKLQATKERKEKVFADLHKHLKDRFEFQKEEVSLKLTKQKLEQIDIVLKSNPADSGAKKEQTNLLREKEERESIITLLADKIGYTYTINDTNYTSVTSQRDQIKKDFEARLSNFNSKCSPLYDKIKAKDELDAKTAAEAAAKAKKDLDAAAAAEAAAKAKRDQDAKAALAAAAAAPTPSATPASATPASASAAPSAASASPLASAAPSAPLPDPDDVPPPPPDDDET